MLQSPPMVGRSRVTGFERAFVPGALACLALGLGACFAGNERPLATDDADFGSGATAGFTGAMTPPFPNSSGGAAGVPGAAPCSSAPVGREAVFAKQVFDAERVATRELFSWTTDEQAASLRRDRSLFTPSEPPDLGTDYAFDVFARVAADGSSREQAELAKVLGSERFANGRYAWSEPWATRMGWPGEDYGDNLLRIVLKPEAWVVVFKAGELSVFDLQNQSVAVAQALATPSRLGAIYYQRDAFSGGPGCDGGFFFGSGGYREFIVGNLEMVEEWSLGTQQIRDRLSTNIAQLSTFFERTRACPLVANAEQWNPSVVCDWEQPLAAEISELSAYEHALSIPSDNYLVVPGRIATLIDTLQGDLFDVDPLVVTPGKP